jgi:hypothetical protein
VETTPATMPAQIAALHLTAKVIPAEDNGMITARRVQRCATVRSRASSMRASPSAPSRITMS